MKLITGCIVGLGCVLLACNSGADEMSAVMADSANYTSIRWLETRKSFDTITMGQQVTISFRFRNTGDKPLYLTQVKAGCGCTVPDYTKGAIAPGGEGEVSGAFNSNKSHTGAVTKQIFVVSNTHDGSVDTLIFAGVINEKNNNLHQ